MNNKTQKKRKTITHKQRKLVHEVLKTGNQTTAALAAYDTKDRATAASLASRELRKDNVKEYIEGLLKEHNVTVKDVIGLHIRNMTQSSHLSTSQKAVESMEAMLGFAGSRSDHGKTAPVTNIAFIVE